MKSLVRNLGVSLTLQMMASNRDTISEIAKFAGIFRQLHYSRQDELEADFVGQRLLRKARIDPFRLKLFFKRLYKADAANKNIDESAFPEILSYFTTHPHTQVRIDKLEPGITNASTDEKALNKAEWRALKNICAQRADPD